MLEYVRNARPIVVDDKCPGNKCCYMPRWGLHNLLNQQYRNSGVESPYTEVMERIIGLWLCPQS